MIGIIVSWALPISAALLLGMLVSWMITRRIVRLSEAASDPAIDSFELLGLQGNDEIARLGEALYLIRAVHVHVELEGGESEGETLILDVAGRAGCG